MNRLAASIKQTTALGLFACTHVRSKDSLMAANGLTCRFALPC